MPVGRSLLLEQRQGAIDFPPAQVGILLNVLDVMVAVLFRSDVPLIAWSSLMISVV
jgi:hypothetical protein